MQNLRYILNEAVVALRDGHSGSHGSFATLGAGTPVAVLDREDHLGLVTVHCDGEHYRLFLRDLETRGQRVDEAAGE